MGLPQTDHQETTPMDHQEHPRGPRTWGWQADVRLQVVSCRQVARCHVGPALRVGRLAVDVAFDGRRHVAPGQQGAVGH